MSCSCRTFLKLAICPHLLGYSMLNCLNLYDKKLEENDSKKFEVKIKRGRRRLVEKAYVKEI